jgi:hypothetical protein
MSLLKQREVKVDSVQLGNSPWAIALMDVLRKDMFTFDDIINRVGVLPVSRTFETVKDVIMEGELRSGDTIMFGEIEYNVLNNHLNNSDGDNSDVFEDAGVPYKDRRAFCTALYGYDAGGDNFPICTSGDYAALTRVVVALMVLISLKQSEKERDRVNKLKAERQEKLTKLRAEKDQLQVDIHTLERELHA